MISMTYRSHIYDLDNILCNLSDLVDVDHDLPKYLSDLSYLICLFNLSNLDQINQIDHDLDRRDRIGKDYDQRDFYRTDK